MDIGQDGYTSDKAGAVNVPFGRSMGESFDKEQVNGLESSVSQTAGFVEGDGFSSGVGWRCGIAGE